MFYMHINIHIRANEEGVEKPGVSQLNFNGY